MRKDLVKAGDAEDPESARKEAKKQYSGKISLERFLRYDQNDDVKLTYAEFSLVEETGQPDLTEADRTLYSDVCFDEWLTYTSVEGSEFTTAAFLDATARHRLAIRAKAQKDPAKLYALNRSNSVLEDYYDLLLVDTNQDGRITRAETRSFWVKKFDGVELTLDAASKVLYADMVYLERMASLDFNQDGALSRDEAASALDAPNDAEWKKLDKDNDDKLSSEEVRAWDLPREAAKEADKKKDSK
jgi:hypothetical protein